MISLHELKINGILADEMVQKEKILYLWCFLGTGKNYWNYIYAKLSLRL